MKSSPSPRGGLPPASAAAPARVLALVTDAFGGYGGIAQYNRDFLRALAALPSVERIEVLPRVAPGELEPLPPSVRQHRPTWDRIAYSARAVSLALQLRPTIVFNGHVYQGPLSQGVAGLTQAKLISQLHGTEVWEPITPLRRRALEASDLVLTVSRDTRARLLSKADVDPVRVPVLNNTIGDDFTPGDRQAARARYGLTDQIAVLTVARLDAREGYKGHDRIIPLICGLRAKGLDLCYLVAGAGEDQSRLEGLVAAHGVESSVRFLGRVPPAGLPDLYRAADLFALPSTGEGFGIVFLEAMACGAPCIGLDVGGAVDALGEGQLGVCVTQAAFAGAFEAAVLSAKAGGRAPVGATQARFGWPAFQSRVSQVMSLL